MILVAPSGAAFDRATEILSELNYIEAASIFVGDLKPTEPAVHLPLAAGLSEELTPVLASIPLSQIGLHLMPLNGRRSYNFPDEAAAREHYDTSIASRLASRRELVRAARGGTKQLGVSPGVRSPAARRQELPAPSLVLLAVPRPP